MRPSRFSEEQIIAMLREQDVGGHCHVNGERHPPLSEQDCGGAVDSSVRRAHPLSGVKRALWWAAGGGWTIDRAVFSLRCGTTGWSAVGMRAPSQHRCNREEYGYMGSALFRISISYQPHKPLKCPLYIATSVRHVYIRSVCPPDSPRWPRARRIPPTTFATASCGAGSAPVRTFRRSL